MAAVTVVHHCGAVRGAAVPMVPTASTVSAQDETAPEDHGDDEDGRGDRDDRRGNAIDPGMSVTPAPASRRFVGPRGHGVRLSGGFDCLLRCFSHVPSLTG